MMSKKVQEAINEQIRQEFYAAHLYLAMSAYSDSLNLPGFAHWMRLQGDEERAHAMRLFDYLSERGGRVILKSVDQPEADFGSLLKMFQRALEHEQKVTELINSLYSLAVAEKDYATQVELQWFVKEQVEEERNAEMVVAQLKMIGDQPAGLLMLDRRLAERTGL